MPSEKANEEERAVRLESLMEQYRAESERTHQLTVNVQRRVTAALKAAKATLEDAQRLERARRR